MFWAKGGAYCLSISYYFEGFNVTNMTWLTATKYMCHKLQRIRNQNTAFSSFRNYHVIQLIFPFQRYMTSLIFIKLIVAFHFQF